MKTYNIILVFVVLFVLGACRTNRQVSQTKETTNGNSTVKITKYRDTILTAPGSSTGFQLPLNALTKCPDGSAPKSADKTYTQKNGNATAKVIVKHDTIIVTAECDSIELATKIRQDFESRDSFTSVKENTSSQTTTGYVFWDLVKAFGLGFLACIIILFILKFYLNVTIHKV
ncbi:hypothetical protein [Epilithonimonas arachidiradicis]|uniref:Lipoprotein n=1 Tax=Epilithonimonas arachidiradicis TaxID=1617282 RepID=A0A420DEM1_9FLAO|nr:hypothetical protein [Epilithonimonas arachidiradicis]RKE90009.1 hypothetical protein BXY58_0594 [Epilithonimonas arachidiradicis]GGG47061.1 hypothetical protein GCM10007332_05690 [Epilithonimonas arachidiradicis]